MGVGRGGGQSMGGSRLCPGSASVHKAVDGTSAALHPHLLAAAGAAAAAGGAPQRHPPPRRERGPGPGGAQGTSSAGGRHGRGGGAGQHGWRAGWLWVEAGSGWGAGGNALARTLPAALRSACKCAGASGRAGETLGDLRSWQSPCAGRGGAPHCPGPRSRCQRPPIHCPAAAEGPPSLPALKAFGRGVIAFTAASQHLGSSIGEAPTRCQQAAGQEAKQQPCCRRR